MMKSCFDGYKRYVNPYVVDFLKSIELDIVFNKAEGCYIFDSNNTAYLDFVSGFGAMTLGHNHPELIKKMKNILDFSMPNINPWGIVPDTALLAEKLVGYTKRKMEKVYFASSGSEAVESALKFALACTGRKAFIAINNGFHGLTLTATALAGNCIWKKRLPEFSVEVDHVDINDVNKIEELFLKKSYAGIIIEPVQGSSGMGIWHSEYFKEVARLAKKHKVMLILDEVMTGLGRTGMWFAYQKILPELSPDIIVISKGLTGGLIPISAVLMTNKVYTGMFGGKAMGGGHGATFSGNALGIACALATLNIIENDKLIDNVDVVSHYINKKLLELKSNGFPIGNISIIGLSVGFEVIFMDSKKYLTAASEVCLKLTKNKVFTTLAPHNHHYIRLTPPLNTSLHDVDNFINALERSMYV